MGAPVVVDKDDRSSPIDGDELGDEDIPDKEAVVDEDDAKDRNQDSVKLLLFDIFFILPVVEKEAMRLLDEVDVCTKEEEEEEEALPEEVILALLVRVLSVKEKEAEDDEVIEELSNPVAEVLLSDKEVLVPLTEEVEEDDDVKDSEKDEPEVVVVTEVDEVLVSVNEELVTLLKEEVLVSLKEVLVSVDPPKVLIVSVKDVVLVSVMEVVLLPISIINEVLLSLKLVVDERTSEMEPVVVLCSVEEVDSSVDEVTIPKVELPISVDEVDEVDVREDDKEVAIDPRQSLMLIGLSRKILSEQAN